VRKAKSDDEIDEIRIIENLVSRTVTPYEYALNIGRLIEINRKESGLRGAESTTPFLAQLAERFKISPTTLFAQRAISNLIPQLGQLLNDKVLTQRTAYQLGQLPEEDQERNACLTTHGISTNSLRAVVASSTWREVESTCRRLDYRRAVNQTRRN
jgi:hypothetical protein